MEEEKYRFTRMPYAYFFEFYSEGPRGLIRKVVQFQIIKSFTTSVFNLAFGDWDESKNGMDDKIVSDNADREKILATVAAVVIKFMNERPDAIIVAVGSTPSRTRLYQIAISKHWDEINELFEIQGYNNLNWEQFQRGINYEGFLLKRRL